MVSENIEKGVMGGMKSKDGKTTVVMMKDGGARIKCKADSISGSALFGQPVTVKMFMTECKFQEYGDQFWIADNCTVEVMGGK